MPRIALEDNFEDIINKAQIGLKLSDQELSQKAEISMEDLLAVKSGKKIFAVIRRIARHLKLGPDSLETIARGQWYPTPPCFPHGFMMFNSPFRDYSVNNYLIWDAKSKEGVVIDTGTRCQELIDSIQVENIRVRYILITHNHPDHIACVQEIAEATGAEVWSHEKEPLSYQGTQYFSDGAFFHTGSLSIKTLSTWGHSPGMVTYYIRGLSWPVAACGDAIFSGSIGGSENHYKQQLHNNRVHLLPLIRDTVIAPGHGPITTLAQEKQHNPFFAR